MLYTNYFEENWDYRHFIAYMYVAIASADYEISEEEKDVLHDKLAPTIFEEDSYKELFNDVLKIFKKHNDNEVLEFIEALGKRHIKDDEMKEKVLNDLHEIIDADGHESGTETIMFISIRKILNSI